MAPEIARSADRSPAVAASFAREVVFPVLAAAVIVVSADIHTPMGLPGHRGLIWLTLLVAVVLATHRRATVLAVGAASTIGTISMHGSVRYLAAAMLLYGVVTVVRQRRWPVVLAAAPIHLVALVGSMWMPEKVLFYLGFGLAAGLLGWAIAAAVRL